MNSVLFNTLAQKDLNLLRKKINAHAYKKSAGITWFWCILDLTLYLSFIFGALFVTPWYFKILFGLLAGISASSMFVLAHDMAHGALFKSKIVSEILGTIYMLPALNVYRLWCFGHNRVHHGFASFSPIDWIWRPLTKNEYNDLSRVKKFLYRIERSFSGCGLHYLMKVWWSKMIFFVPEGAKAKDKRSITFVKSIVAGFAIMMGIIGYHLAGLVGIFSVVILPFLVFTYIISFIVYLHHTHPNLPFFDNRADWNHSIGSIFCTTVIRSNWLIEKVITHNIFIHTPHHVDFRIPFYRLKTALVDIKENYGQYLHEYRLGFPIIFQIFNRCKLYDYEKHEWYIFKK